MIAKVAWGAIGFGLVFLMLIIAWRARNIVSWNRDIRKELRSLAKEAESASEARRAGIARIQERCDAISRTLSPAGVVGVEQLHAYIRSIAACSNPDSTRPELQVSLGHLIKSIDISLFRFDRIIRRPGFQRLKSINIKTVRSLYHWSETLMKRPMVRWLVAHRDQIGPFGLIRLVVLPDPISLLLFLSRKIVILVLMRNLLVDITLFVGKLALNAYDQSDGKPTMEDAEMLEETLMAMSRVEIPPQTDQDPAIAEIRRQLVGFSTIMLSPPAWRDVTSAVVKAAENIAVKYFPDSDHPVEEATIGALLDRSRSWLKTLGKGDNITIVRYIYKTRLETIFQAKDVTDLVLTPTVRSIIRTSFGAYGWLKWPLRIYRRVKRFTIPRLAMDLGWFLGKKSALVLLYGSAFDHACRELEWVYRMSAAADGTAREDRSDDDSV